MILKHKKAIAIILLVLFAFSIPMCAYAHRGGTDSKGGHHDYKNQSGLGSYHYHHGYKPHLHPNGVCPYGGKNISESNGGTSGSSGSSGGSSAKAYAAASVAKTVKNSNNVTVTVSSGKIAINGIKIDNSKLKYPFISYNNICYLPLTYNNKINLGIEAETKNNTMHVKKVKAPNAYAADVAGTCKVGQKGTAIKLGYNITIDGVNYNYTNEYPLLKYKDIVYIPLTWGFTNAMGITTEWTKETGLAVNTTRRAAGTTSATQQKPATTQTQSQPVAQTQPSTNAVQIPQNDPILGAWDYTSYAQNGSFYELTPTGSAIFMADGKFIITQERRGAVTGTISPVYGVNQPGCSNFYRFKLTGSNTEYVAAITDKGVLMMVYDSKNGMNLVKSK